MAAPVRLELTTLGLTGKLSPKKTLYFSGFQRFIAKKSPRNNQYNNTFFMVVSDIVVFQSVRRNKRADCFFYTFFLNVTGFLQAFPKNSPKRKKSDLTNPFYSLTISLVLSFPKSSFLKIKTGKFHFSPFLMLICCPYFKFACK